MKDYMKQVSDDLMIPVPNYGRHNLDSQTLTTTGFGRLTPVYLEETVPGGKYTIQPEMLVRMTELQSPMMTRCTAKIMYFYIPYRILWNGWEDHIIGRKDPVTGLERVHPYYVAARIKDETKPTGANGVNTFRLADYFQLKTPEGTIPSLEEVKMNPFPFYAYQRIWNYHFRHKAVIEEEEWMCRDGEQDNLLFFAANELRQITYEPDYFNAALPTPQKGGPVFIDDHAPVRINSDLAGQTNLAVLTAGGGISPFGVPVQRQVTDDEDVDQVELYAQVEIHMEEIRRAAALQKYMELENHVRTYSDYLKAHFNVDYPDYRAQEPEYIGGASQPIIIGDVMNTADQRQGRVVGYGSGYAKGDSFTYYTHEHGMIIGLAVVTYKSLYINAKAKLHFKINRFDYFNPAFDGLGEQAIKTGEVNVLNGSHDTTWGYVPRHYEYRSSYDYVTGEMGTIYRHWHLGRDYPILQGIQKDFFSVLDERRIHQYTNTDYDNIILQVYNDVRALLPMQAMPEPIL